MSGTETITAETSLGHRVEILITRDRLDRVDEVVVQAWDSPDGRRLATHQLSAFATQHLPNAILVTYQPGVDGDGVGYALGIYKWPERGRRR